MSYKAGFNKKNLAVLRAELNKVLAEAGFDDLSFEIGRMTFDAGAVDMKITAKVKGVKTMTDHMLESNIKTLGLLMEKNGRRLVEYKPRNHKYPFIFEEVRTGKRYKCDSMMAKLHFAA